MSRYFETLMRCAATLLCLLTFPCFFLESFFLLCFVLCSGVTWELVSAATICDVVSSSAPPGATVYRQVAHKVKASLQLYLVFFQHNNDVFFSIAQVFSSGPASNSMFFFQDFSLESAHSFCSAFFCDTIAFWWVWVHLCGQKSHSMFLCVGSTELTSGISSSV